MNHRKIALSNLISENNLSRGAELGVWKGETFMYLIEKHDSLFMIGVDAYVEMPDNHGPGKEQYIKGKSPYDWDHEKHFKNITKFCSKYPDRTKFIRNTTEESSKLVEDESLDFVFIDADHSEEGVSNDIKNWYPKVKIGGFITGHDYSKGWITVMSAVDKAFGKENIKTDIDNVWIYQKNKIIL